MSINVIGLIVIFVFVVVIPFLVYCYLKFLDSTQEQHSILRKYPILGNIRYFSEMVGPELRQYLFSHDNTGKPFSRTDFLDVVLPAKYIKNIVSFGSKRNLMKLDIILTMQCFQNNRMK